uniref:Uncharacterized protein n=1 Tax=Anguilla anguilla TaxID=7936 RepID=A0A0E9UQV7_ANGAN
MRSRRSRAKSEHSRSKLLSNRPKCSETSLCSPCRPKWVSLPLLAALGFYLPFSVSFSLLTV